MPYGSTSELPAAAKKLPSAAQNIFKSAFNAAYKQYKGDEEKAFAVAWAAVKNKYKKEGDKWVAKDSTPRLEDVCDPDSEDYDPEACEELGGEVMDGRTEVVDSMDFTEVYAFDSTGLRETSEGYLLCEPRIARTGIQVYRGSDFGLKDRDTVRVLRPESEVFSTDALKTLAHRPVTIGHPDELVTSKNWKRHAVGNTGSEVARDGQFIRVPMMLMDADRVRNSRAKELSVGYTSDIVWKAGITADGEEYDAVQRNIRANHIAIVAQARGGPKLRLGDESKGDKQMSRELLTRTIAVDGIEVTMADQDAAIVNRAMTRLNDELKQSTANIEALKKQVADQAAELATAKKSVETKDGEIIALKKKVEDAAVKPEDLDRRVIERNAVIDAARKVLGKEYRADGKSDSDIKREAVNKFLGDAAKGLTDEQIIGAFIGATAATGTSEPRRLSDALHSNQQNVSDAEKSWLENQARKENAWQGEAGKAA